MALVLCRNDHDAERRSTVKGVGISIASRRYMPTRTRACLDHLIRPETLAVDGVLPGEHP